MRHTISVLVENKAGVLARVAGLFSARGFNISSLSVGETEDPSISRMTIVVSGDETILEQIEKQLNKLVDVIKVSDFSKVPHLERDLALVKISSDKAKRTEIFQIVNIFLLIIGSTYLLTFQLNSLKIRTCIWLGKYHGSCGSPGKSWKEF